MKILKTTKRPKIGRSRSSSARPVGVVAAQRRLVARIAARRKQIGPVGFSLTQAIREDRDRGC